MNRASFPTKRTRSENRVNLKRRKNINKNSVSLELADWTRHTIAKLHSKGIYETSKKFTELIIKSTCNSGGITFTYGSIIICVRRILTAYNIHQREKWNRDEDV